MPDSSMDDCPELQGLMLAAELLADRVPARAREYIRHTYGHLSHGYDEGGHLPSGYLPPECGPQTVLSPVQHAELGRRYIQDTYGGKDDDQS